MIKAVIFDLDNTLYSYDNCHEKAIESTYNYLKKSKEISYEKFIKLLNISKKEVKSNLKNTASSHNRILYFQGMLEKLEINPIGIADKMYDVYWNTFFEEMALRDGVIELFKFLKQNNIKIGLCTDLTTYLQFKKVQKLDITNYIDAIVSSEEAGIEKPNEKMFITILEKLSVENNECIYVGDDEKKDIQGAEKIGICALKIDNDFKVIKEKIESSVLNEINKENI